MSTLHEAAQALRDEQLLRAAYAAIEPPRVPCERGFDDLREPELEPRNPHTPAGQAACALVACVGLLVRFL